MDLFEHSVDVILKNQAKSGAYVACPNFPIYHYCWLRDGSFTAYAMDRTGHLESAEKFYRWVGIVIQRYGKKVDLLEKQIKLGTKPDHNAIMNTRFTLDGLKKKPKAAGEISRSTVTVPGYGVWQNM
jgi:GH15 family glucan-1,4-alpha-glucosidase